MKSTNLARGQTKSCGCLRDDLRKEMVGDKNANWKGGRHIKQGYVNIYMPEHPNRTCRGYVLEHIVVMSKFLNRPLVKGETVHHKNGQRQDNRLCNLELFTSIHPSGQRVSDVVEFCEYYLKNYKKLSKRMNKK